jgi:hypothetical protein
MQVWLWIRVSLERDNWSRLERTEAASFSSV